MSQVKPIPDGQPAITPHLVVKGAADAIAFYEKALGGQKLHEMLDPSSGKIMHAAVKFGDSQIFLADEYFPSIARSARWRSAARRSCCIFMSRTWTPSSRAPSRLARRSRCR